MNPLDHRRRTAVLAMRTAKRVDVSCGRPRCGPAPAADGFWAFAALLGLFYIAASAPSPLYADYAARWHFSDSVLTVVFAVYAVPLLVFGGCPTRSAASRSHWGAFGLLAASLALFTAADGLAVLITARVLQKRASSPGLRRRTG